MVDETEFEDALLKHREQRAHMNRMTADYDSQILHPDTVMTNGGGTEVKGDFPSPSEPWPLLTIEVDGSGAATVHAGPTLRPSATVRSATAAGTGVRVAMTAHSAGLLPYLRCVPAM